MDDRTDYGRAAPAGPRTRPGAQAAGWLAALAEPTRLELVRTLATGPRPVTHLADACEVDAVNASYHLRLLKAAGVVTANKSGRFVRYALRGAVVADGTLELSHPSGLKVTVPHDRSPSPPAVPGT